MPENQVGLPSTYCGLPMFPEGPECLREVGHDGGHHSMSDNIQWSYTSCWNVIPHSVWGEARCIRPQGHPEPCGE